MKEPRQVQEDAVGPIIHPNTQATSWQPGVKGLKIIVNSIYNGWRMEEVRLDR